MDPVTMIQIKRRHERPHTDEELEWWIQLYTSNQIPEYQMSAWLMAVCWRGMTDHETATLTRCMVESGERVNWDALKLNHQNDTTKLVLADKHSSGGVGDKISIVLAPLAACLGVKVPMMAGRGLGHTGGTIDKLESIPGYQTSIPIDKFQSIVASDVGCTIVSASQTLCPADRKLYALRDVTATVSSIPLQTASIMSKKIAENPDALVLDVKYGKASFQDNVKDATVLAHSMIATGEKNGVSTTAFLTRMDHCIGHAAGNWLEIYECLQLMKSGQGSPDLIILVVVQTAQMVAPLYPQLSWEQVVDKTLEMLQSGKVFAKFCEMAQAQGADTTKLTECPPNQATYMHDIVCPLDTSSSVAVKDINALTVGEACVKLGAGRTDAANPVDPAAGIWFHVHVGDTVQKGDKIATLYTNLSEPILQQATQMMTDAIQYTTTANETVVVPQVISHRVTPGGIIEEFILPESLKKLPKL